MTRIDPIMTRVTSRDGTEIAYWTSGDGPPLVLVHGTTADHTTWDALLPHLGREFEDVAAVVDAVAAAAGSAVNLLGHSFGGLCAFGGASLTANVRRLVLYEGWPLPDPEVVRMPHALTQRLKALLADGDDQAALELFYREVVHMSEEELDLYRSLPHWRERVAAAHTIVREDGAIPHGVLTAELAAAVGVPVLLLVGADSPPDLQGDYQALVAALSDRQVAVLDGQQHLAHRLAPELFARHVVAFLRGRP